VFSRFSSPPPGLPEGDSPKLPSANSNGRKAVAQVGFSDAFRSPLENTCRESLLPTEAFHFSKRFEKACKQLAKAAEREGGKKGGATAGRRRDNTNRGSGSSTTLKQDNSKRSAERSARAAGKSAKTMAKIAAIVASADRKLIDEMNRTGKVNGVYKKLVVRQKAEAISKEPVPLPTGQFRVIVCDPPWEYKSRSEDPTHRASNP